MTTDEIKRKKKALGLSAEQLSERSGVPLGTLQKILSGETRSPRYETLKALEQALTSAKTISYDNSAYEMSDSSALVLRDALPEERAGTSYLPYKKGRCTVKDYRKLPEETRTELIDGVFYDLAAPSFVHQHILSELYFTIRSFLDQTGGSCLPMMAPLDVQLDEDEYTMLQPDLIVLCDKKKIRRRGIFGAPDLVIEIVSESTAKKDYVLKVSKYMEAGVREFWILDPLKKRLLIYSGDNNGIPYIGPLEGRMPVGIFDGRLEIDLDRISALILDYPDAD